MGLDTTHGAWHGPYGSFSRWRREVAVAAGIIQADESLYPLRGYDSDTLKDSPIDWTLWDAQTDYMGKWKQDPDDVIWVLLAHSDCEGHIKERFLLPLADRLEALVPAVDHNEFGGYSGYARNRTQQFVDGLRLAASEGKRVKFF